MNKDELKEYVLRNHLTVNKGYIGEQCYVSNSYVSMSEQDFTNLIDQLDEPEKPVIPDYVADWIEKCKTKGKTLDRAYSDFAVENVNVIKWLYHEGDRNEKINLFARAWIDGYKVEEKKYYVKFTEHEHSYLNRLNDGELIVSDFTKKLCLFTEKELKDYGERYWAFRKPVEEMEE